MKKSWRLGTFFQTNWCCLLKQTKRKRSLSLPLMNRYRSNKRKKISKSLQMGGDSSPFTVQTIPRFPPLSLSLIWDKKTESLIEVIDESIEARHRDGSSGGGVMDVGVEYNAEFWPIEHPVEPPDEDQPVKCPMPDSSIIKDAQMWPSYSPWKRADVSATMTKEEMVVVTAERPPARAVRKRRHTRTHHGGDNTLTPLLRMPPLHPLPTHNITIFQMLQQFNKFES